MRVQRDLANRIEPEFSEHPTALFLFDQTFRYLHGVYEALEPAGVNLDPLYLRASRGGSAGDGAGSPFPVQVRFRRVFDFPPLPEIKFCHLVSYNDGTNIFRHGLGESKTHALLRLLDRPEEAPADNVLPYETNGYQRILETPRFLEQRRALYGDSSEC